MQFRVHSWLYLIPNQRVVAHIRCIRRHVTILRRLRERVVRHGWRWFHHRHHGDIDVVPHHERDGESRERQHVQHHPSRHHVWKREHTRCDLRDIRPSGGRKFSNAANFSQRSLFNSYPHSVRQLTWIVSSFTSQFSQAAWWARLIYGMIFVSA